MFLLKASIIVTFTLIMFYTISMVAGTIEVSAKNNHAKQIEEILNKY